MFFIFGWNRKKIKDHGPALKKVCQNCNHENYARCLTVATWSTVFFLPFIPYHWKKFLCCPICKSGTELSAEDFKKMRDLAKSNKPLLAGKIPDFQISEKPGQMMKCIKILIIVAVAFPALTILSLAVFSLFSDSSGKNTPLTTPAQSQDMKMILESHLAGTFGKDFLSVIDTPSDVKIGERVLYILKDHALAIRDDEKQKNARQEMEKLLQEVASGAVSTQVSQGSSNLPYPRIIDIPGWGDFQFELKEFANSNANPKSDFPVLWMMGTLIGYDYKQFVYVDFREPKVKAAFVVDYDVENIDADSEFSSQKLQEDFKIFQNKKKELVQQAKKAKWSFAKIVQYHHWFTDMNVPLTVKFISRQK